MKLFGIPIKIEIGFLIVTFFLGTGHGINVAMIFEWMVVVLISVLIHELGHALTAKFFKLEPAIILYGMGGLTHWDPQLIVTPLRQILITLAGPFAGFTFGFIVLAIGIIIPPSSPLLATTYRDLLWVNFGWGIFNLLPMLPLDGGQILGSIETWIKKRESRVITHVLSLLIALGVLILALSFGLIWIGLLGAWFAFSNGAGLVNAFKSGNAQQQQNDLVRAQLALKSGDYTNALKLAQRVVKDARVREIEITAYAIVIRALLKLDQLAEAEQEIEKFDRIYGGNAYLNAVLYFKKKQYADAVTYLRKSLDQMSSFKPSEMTDAAIAKHSQTTDVLYKERFELAHEIQQAAFQTGDFDSSLAAGSIAFEQTKDATIAYNNACAASRAGELTKGLFWVEVAINSGFTDRSQLTNDPDLELLRQASGFASLLTKIPT